MQPVTDLLTNPSVVSALIVGVSQIVVALINRSKDTGKRRIR